MPSSPSLPPLPGRLSRRLAAPAARHPRLVLVLVALSLLASLLPASRIRIDADLAALLARGTPAAEDYRVFLRAFGGFEKVFVVVRSPGRPLADPSPLLDAAEGLAAALARSPEVADARAGLTADDERFFTRWILPRMPLLAAEDPGALARRLSPESLHARVAWMRRTLSSPAGSALGPLLAADPLGLSEDLLSQASSMLPVEPVSGSFLSPRGDAALVILTPSRSEIDPAGGRALQAALSRAYARVRAASPVPLEFSALGGPLYAAEDEEILRGDLSRTSSATIGGVSLVLLAGFEGLLLPVAILAAVSAGLLWTAGFAGLAFGSVTVIGVGFAAALLGMGVDYGIHGGVRYRALRLAGHDAGRAVVEVFRENGPGVATAALTTACGLSALCFAHFRPLREIGLVLGVGVTATLVATATLSAALVAAWGRPPAPPRLWRTLGRPALRRLVGGAAAHPRLVLGGALLLSALAAGGLVRLRLSTDLRALRPAHHPAERAERLLVQSFGLGLDTFSVVVPGSSLDEALDRAARARELLRARLGPGVEITSPSDWLLGGERLTRRLAVLRRLPLTQAAGELERQLQAAGFRSASFGQALSAMRELGAGRDPGAPPREAWPSWMAELVRLGPGAPGAGPRGALVAVHVRLPRGPSPAVLDALSRELSTLCPGAALASAVRIGAEIKGVALADLRRSSALALALIAAVVLLSFRGGVVATLLSFAPLVLGCLWTFGFWGWLGRPLDLLAIFTVPLLFSTGIILGAHAVHWRRLHAREGFTGTMDEMGLAMILAALTTAVGFGSLASSRVPGLASAGVIVAAGITLCLVAALFVLPALEALHTGWRARRPEGDA